MKRLSLILATVGLMTIISCKSDKKQDAEMQESTEVENTEVEVKGQETYSREPKEVRVILEAKSGSTAKGSVTFSQEDGVVTMMAVLNGLKEGTHAIHIHEKSDCSAEDGTSTGGHWNPTNQPHGKWGDAAGYHKGDIGNVEANANGNAKTVLTTDQWCIGCGDPNKDILGRAIIVHEGVDDFKTQPTGDAGGRISCGGIIK
ncbi:superoxide dismutase family protein [Subsaxibacter sp. CAU 1640]|uniref:superoxide dismutase family protein n=1 Tax=Subsaxibacter sp. CAU 1640 TaxID=2933271 RepID=UPI0020054B1D|nr:superoxide dismutase family protein [Subsaxibacter sp. CAU 1640]MCK7589998.1 superoxide dismutase family protein [Subsaxibacter sp. CAU 1640]